jgi:alcohol-forming fatty acyl-CoA reductase
MPLNDHLCFSLVRVQKRISEGMDMVQYFTMRKWNFLSPYADLVRAKLSDEDKLEFPTDEENLDVQAYINAVVLGSRQYCLKEPLSTLPKARTQLKMQAKSI